MVDISNIILTQVNEEWRRDAANSRGHRTSTDSRVPQYSWVEFCCVGVHNRICCGHCKLPSHLERYGKIN